MPHAGMSDASVAYKCSASLKHEATTAAMAACEAVHPQIRQIFAQACQEAIQVQSQFSQLMTQRGWYVPLEANAANMGSFVQNLQQWSNMGMQTATAAPGAGVSGAQGYAGFGGNVGGNVAGNVAGNFGGNVAGNFGGSVDPGLQGYPGNRF